MSIWIANPQCLVVLLFVEKVKVTIILCFFRYLLASPTARKKIIVKGAGAQHFNIGQDGLSKVCLNIPSIQEQEKIAKLFEFIDTRIATQNKIIEKLQSLIKGLNNTLQYDTGGKTVCLGDILLERSERSQTNNQHEVLSSTV